MLSQIDFIHFFFPPYNHKAAFVAVFPCLPEPYKQAINFSSGSCITRWFDFFYKTLVIFYCEHLQHFAKEIRSSYLMSLPKSRY